MTEFYIGYICENVYPDGMVEWCDNNNATIDEIEPIDNVRRFEIKAIPQPTPEEERARLDALTLTPADVERALYKEKEMDFEDLKELIVQRIPQIDVKALSIEFRAKDFYRGATFNGVRLFDVVGALLGYTSDDMDYLFENKELPNGN